MKFSTVRSGIDAEVAEQLAESDYVDAVIRSTAPTPTPTTVHGEGSFATAVQAMEHLQAAGFEGFKISVVMTRHNIPQVDEFKAMADHYGASSD